MGEKLTYQVPPAFKKPLTVGDCVSVHGRDGEKIGETIITRRDRKGIVVTDDGRRWVAKNGYWLGDALSWPFPSIRRMKRKTGA